MPDTPTRAWAEEGSAPTPIRRLLLLSLVLVAVVAASFAVFLPWLGFYGDDWEIIGHLIRSPDQGLWGLIGAYHQATGTYFHLRPADLVYFPTVYWLGGMSPWKYQLIYLVLESVTALSVFHALRLATRDLGRSFLTACLFACYPSHTATHHCFLGPYTPAMAAFAAALWLHALWIGRGDRRALWGSLLFFAVGDLLYEAVLPLVILMPVLGLVRCLQSGRPLKDAFRKTLSQSAPIFATAAILVAYFVVIQHMHPGTISRRLIFDPPYFLKVLGRGFECSFTGLADLFRHSARLAFHNLSPLLWLAGAVGAISLAALLVRLPGRKILPAEAERSWLWGAVLVFLAAYVPYAVSADRYIPHTFDVQNRLNGTASLPAAMIVAYALERLGSRARAAVFAVLLFSFAVINWETGWEWTRSWSIQRGVLSDIAERLPGPGDDPILVYLKGAPLQLDSAPVFNVSVFFAQALKTYSRRRDVHGVLWGDSPRDERLLSSGTRRFVFHFDARRLEPIGP